MFIITLEDKEEGVYSIVDEEGEYVIPVFEDEEDAERYYYMLEAGSQYYPPLQIFQIEDEHFVKVCEQRDQKYVIITRDDLIVPPTPEEDQYDLL